MLLDSIISCLVIAVVGAANCPNGGEIIALGISEDGKKDVVDEHNSCRLKIAKGEIPEQPRGINLKRMCFDRELEKEARVVSVTCELKSKIVTDDRWPYVGQNLYLERSSKNTTDQNWKAAVTSWFKANVDYKYPTGDGNSYTQVVWAESRFIGCDFISFYDPKYPHYPYTKMYTCNYGPGGNVVGRAPYETGTSGCENLC